MAKMFLTVALAALVASIFPLTAQPPADEKAKRVKELQAEIAKTQAKLDALNKELAGLKPPAAAPAVAGTLRHESFKVGAIGTWMEGEYAHKVLEIIDDNSLYMAISINPRINVVVKGIKTKGLVDGAIVPLPGVWEFTGTTKHAGKSVFVIEPHKEKK